MKESPSLLFYRLRSHYYPWPYTREKNIPWQKNKNDSNVIFRNSLPLILDYTIIYCTFTVSNSSWVQCKDYLGYYRLYCVKPFLQLTELPLYLTDTKPLATNHFWAPADRSNSKYHERSSTKKCTPAIFNRAFRESCWAYNVSWWVNLELKNENTELCTQKL